MSYMKSVKVSCYLAGNLYLLYTYNFLISYKHIICASVSASLCISVNIGAYIHVSISVESSYGVVMEK